MDHIPEKRAGDAERSQALDRLGQYFADGYLDIHEFDDRTGKAALARTQGEIDALFVDLPAQPATAEPRRELSAQRELDEVMTRGKNSSASTAPSGQRCSSCSSWVFSYSAWALRG